MKAFWRSAVRMRPSTDAMILPCGASPLKFQPVVTSAFSRSRPHQVLREYRAHLGVDYPAPAGTPAVARLRSKRYRAITPQPDARPGGE
jgi:murein DD-endopeptidase MepM/ murein hydrolase activator NlpD